MLRNRIREQVRWESYMNVAGENAVYLESHEVFDDTGKEK